MRTAVWPRDKGGGRQWSTSTNANITLAELLEYDGVFVAGSGVPNNDVLIDYVNADGSVYLCGGTSSGNNEINDWNCFLNAFGIKFIETWDRYAAVVPVEATPRPIFEGVVNLYQNDGRNIEVIDDMGGATTVVSYFRDAPRYVVYDASFASAGGGCYYKVKSSTRTATR